MEDIKYFIEWKRPFAKTPNQFYKKNRFELLKQFAIDMKKTHNI